MHARIRRQPRRNGFIIVYMSVGTVALMAFASLAFDWGRVQTAKQELQNAADSAARAAAAGLVDNTSAAKAILEASYNKADGTQVTILSSDVETGNWNVSSNSFVVGGTPTNAVRVTASRTAARGNAIPLVFGRVIGYNTQDVIARAVCRQSSLGVIGITSVSITGSGKVSRSTSEGGGVTVASNGTYVFGGSGNTITGDAFYRSTAPTGTVSGRLVALPYDFAYAAPVATGGTPVTNFTLTYNQPASGDYNVSGNLYITNGGTITLTGNVRIFVAGTVTVDGTASVVTNGYKLTVLSTAGAAVTFSNTNPITVALYAPNSTVTLNGPGTVTGSVVANTLALKCPMVFTASQPIPYTPSGGDVSMTAGGEQTMR